MGELGFVCWLWLPGPLRGVEVLRGGGAAEQLQAGNARDALPFLYIRMERNIENT